METWKTIATIKYARYVNAAPPWWFRFDPSPCVLATDFIVPRSWVSFFVVHVACAYERMVICALPAYLFDTFFRLYSPRYRFAVPQFYPTIISHFDVGVALFCGFTAGSFVSATWVNACVVVLRGLFIISYSRIVFSLLLPGFNSI